VSAGRVDFAPADVLDLLKRVVDGVAFETIGQYVDRWKAANRLDRWKSEHPEYAEPGTRGSA
jgi:hypothetical protein